MYIYFLTFIVIIFLAIIIQKLMVKHKKTAILLCLLSIFILSLLAGLRSLDVGRDLRVYVISSFNNSRNFSSIISYLKYYYFKEPLYYALNYLVYKYSGNINVLLFAIQLIITSIIYYIAYKESENNKGTFSVYIFSYIIIWYNTSFNIVRQSLAIAIMLLGFKSLIENKNKKFVLLIFLAFLFHSSAIFCLLFPLIKKVSKLKNRKLYLVLLPIIFILIFTFLKPIMSTMSVIPFFEKYYNYLEIDTTNLLPKFAILKLIFLIFFLFFSTGETFRKAEENKIFSFMAITDFMLYLSSGFIMFGYRMSYLFLPIYIYMIPRIDKSYDNKPTQKVFRIAMIIILCTYWYYRYVSIGYDGTIPYSFFWKN